MLTSLVMEFATIKAQASSQEEVWQIVKPMHVTPEPLSTPITIHTPIGAERNNWIAVGKYVEYMGNEK